MKHDLSGHCTSWTNDFLGFPQIVDIRRKHDIHFQGLSYPEMQGSIDTHCLPYLYYNIFPVQYLVCDLNI